MSYILALDIELTGEDPFLHHLIDIGAVLFSVDNMKEIEDFSFKAIINMPSDKIWDDETVKNFWQAKVRPEYYAEIKRVAENGQGLDMKNAITQFVEFLNKSWEFTNGDMVLGAGRCDQDVFRISYELCKYGFRPLNKIFGRDMRVIDFSSFAQGVSMTLHTDIKNFEKRGHGFDTTEAAFRYFRINSRPNKQKTHQSLDDARREACSHTIILNAIQNVIAQFSRHNKNNNF
jgi:oligoribonuclease (3'-5' exoribonuclease)